MVHILELPDFKPHCKVTIADVVLDLSYTYAVESGVISIEQLSRILFAAQGCTAKTWGKCLRASPSAGATYPLQAYVETRLVEGLQHGVYQYVSPSPFKHLLEQISNKLPEGLGSFTVYFEENFEKTTGVYGRRGYMYVREELGHAVQSIILESSALNLAAKVRYVESSSTRVSCYVDIGLRGVRLQEKSFPVSSLPDPRPPSLCLEEAISIRRSVRKYSQAPVSSQEVSSILLWSLAGEPRPYPPLDGGYRINCYLVTRFVDGLRPGVYKYEPTTHRLESIGAGDYTRKLADACLSQEWVARAALNIILCTPSTEDLAAEIEAGMVGQNLYLSATSLGLGTVAVGAFFDDEVASVLGVSERPLYVFPIGRQ
ncbi:MAG: nitroreductase family protein [Thermofilaceae archaeon]|nr:nitroreductase family protein [Thermofilaceae archaeon]